MTEREYMRIRSIAVTAFCFAAAIAVGLYAAYVDQHNATEAYPVLAISLLGSFILGLIRPAHAWRWALVIGVCIAFAPRSPLSFSARLIQPRAWAILLVVMVPGMIGAYSGWMARSVAQGCGGPQRLCEQHLPRRDRWH